jgi:DNA-binding LytR/AlgR family response regulator
VTTLHDGPELTAVIADDEPLARSRILELLKRHTRVRVVTQCATGGATVEAVRQLIRAAMAELEQRLDPARFLRIHRSTIVQCSRIRELYADQHGDYIAVLERGTRLRVSRHYREEALRRLGMQW